MTLISIHNSEGCVGRCDSRCYNAQHEKCVCCCGGMNHGKGLQKAIDNTSEYAKESLEDWNKKHPGERIEFEPVQEELFEIA